MSRKTRTAVGRAPIQGGSLRHGYGTSQAPPMRSTDTAPKEGSPGRGWRRTTHAHRVSRWVLPPFSGGPP